jgi:hypothetical protein
LYLFPQAPPWHVAGLLYFFKSTYYLTFPNYIVTEVYEVSSLHVLFPFDEGFPQPTDFQDHLLFLQFIIMCLGLLYMGKETGVDVVS